jgi:signal transduction histidine kinase
VVVAHLLFLAVCSLAGLAVGDGVHRYLVNAFVSQSGAEAATALELVDAFVTTYAGERERADARTASVPATFRAHALARFAEGNEAPSRLRVAMVGMPNREIVTKAGDAHLTAELLRLEAIDATAAATSLATVEGRRVLRTALPSRANQASCVDCHNRLQPESKPWAFGEMMGALVVDAPAEEALAVAWRDGWIAGVAAGLIGYLIGIGAYLVTAYVQRVRQRAARRGHERLSGAIEALPDGIAVFDRNDRLVLANPAYRRLHRKIADMVEPGVEFEAMLRAMVGQGEFDLGDATPDELVAHRMAQHRQPGPPLVRRLADGGWQQVREQQLPDGGTAVVVLDITAEKEREAALHAAKETAEATNRARSDFLANMSHELKTPLNAIIGFGEVIQGEAPAEPQAGYAGEIIASGRRLLQVINDILDMARIEAGRYELNLQPMSVTELVEDCLALIVPEAEQRGVRLSSEVHDRLPTVLVDLRASRQILLNLLSNGVKFTPSGGAVTVSAAPALTGGVTVTVTDTGVGIGPEDLKRLGEPFVQLEAGLDRRHEGTGLGLAISRRLAEQQGGGLAIDSRLGTGTRIALRLPGMEARSRAA